MFNDLIVSSVDRKRAIKPWTVVVSAIIQGAILCALVVIPLLYTQALPKEMLTTFLVAPPLPPPPPPLPPPASASAVKHVEHLVQQNKMVAPTIIPKNIEILKEEAPAPEVAGVTGGVIGGVPGGQAGGVLGGVIGGTGTNMPPPPAPPPVAPVRVSGNVMAGKQLYAPTPVYPIIAREAHIQGTIILHAIIAKDGTIQQLTYVSGPALLMQSAEKTVQQWRYQPYLLSGEPVAVETTISVVYILNG